MPDFWAKWRQTDSITRLFALGIQLTQLWQTHCGFYTGKRFSEDTRETSESIVCVLSGEAIGPSVPIASPSALP